MFDFLVCFIVITLVNLLCIGFGFLAFLAKEDPIEFDKAFSNKLRKAIDEEAYVPEED